MKPPFLLMHMMPRKFMVEAREVIMEVMEKAILGTALIVTNMVTPFIFSTKSMVIHNLTNLHHLPIHAIPLLRKSHFTTVGKRIPPRLTNYCEVRGGYMYFFFHHDRAIMIIRYVARYLS